MTYKNIKTAVTALSDGVKYEVSVLSNISALLWENVPDINWVGFYLKRDGKLILGPFQGKIACTEIAFGRGVCGKAAERESIILVPNVHEFEDHIACDCASNSEIVLPIFKNCTLYGVLDIDSPTVGRFTEDDKIGLCEIANEIGNIISNL